MWPNMPLSSQVLCPDGALTVSAEYLQYRQAGRRQTCQPRQVRKEAAATGFAGCPALSDMAATAGRFFYIQYAEYPCSIYQLKLSRFQPYGLALHSKTRFRGSLFIATMDKSCKNFCKNSVIWQARIMSLPPRVILPPCPHGHSPHPPRDRRNFRWLQCGHAILKDCLIC